MAVEHVTETRLNRLSPAMPGKGMMDISICEDGRIRLPGAESGFSIDSYLPLVHLYASILEASRILDRYRHLLRSNGDSNPQAPLTPLTPSTQQHNLFYKREDLTITKAYKVRGAVVAMAKMMEFAPKTGFLAVSTGNHALGVLKAAEILRPSSVRIVVPRNTAECKLNKIRNRVEYLQELELDASLVHIGESFDEAREWAMSQDTNEYYIDPYSDPWVVAGQGTVGLELFQQITPLLAANPDVNELVVVAPIGGGGLLAGTATGLKMASSWDPRFRNVNVNLVGVRLADVNNTALGDAIRVAEIASDNRVRFDSWDITEFYISDTHMSRGMQQVLEDIKARIEGASGGTLFPVTSEEDQYAPTANRMVVTILSGGNV